MPGSLTPPAPAAAAPFPAAKLLPVRWSRMDPHSPPGLRWFMFNLKTWWS